MSLFDGYMVNQEIITVIKIFPDFVRLYQYKNPFLLKRFDLDPYNPNLTKKNKKIFLEPEDLENKSLRRAKTNLIDTAFCNDFDMFLTFTFAEDRDDVDAKKQQMAYWLNNQRILHGAFRYILVPEYHKDGTAIHFHGLFGGYNGNLVDSGHMQKGRTVYNVKSYRAGFTTAVKIDDFEKTVGYISKYITKEMPKFKNKQRYWCSNGLKRPLKIINPLLSNEDFARFAEKHDSDNQLILEMRGQFTDADILRIADFGKRRYDDLIVSEL